MSTAILARFKCCTPRRSITVAVFALSMSRKGDLFFYSLGSGKEIDRQICLNIRPSPRTTGASAAAENTPTKHVTKRLEYIAQVMELLPGTLQTRMPISIVARPFFGVTQNLKCLGCFFKASDRRIIVRIFIRMKLYRKLAIRYGNFIRGGGLSDL